MRRALAIAVLVFAGLQPVPAGAEEARCRTMDVVVALDVSGSMSGALLTLKWRIGTLMETLVTASDGDIRLGLVAFNERIMVAHDLAGAPGPEQIAPFLAALGGLAAWGGDSLPELSAESLNTVLNRLGPEGRVQFGWFTGVFDSPNRVMVLVTDQLPGGFDDVHGPEDVALAEAMIARALELDVRISTIYVPTDPEPDPAVEALMRRYAESTGGVFVRTDRSGTGATKALVHILETCGLGAVM